MSTPTIRLVTRSGPVRFNMTGIDTSTTIVSLKDMIASAVGIFSEDQCILRKCPGFTGYKEMRGEQTMGECGITADVHLFVWSSTDPVVMRVRAHEEKSRKEAEARWDDGREERESEGRAREARQATSRRKREEERLTQVFLEGEYEMELRREADSRIFWKAWRKKHNLFDPAS